MTPRLIRLQGAYLCRPTAWFRFTGRLMSDNFHLVIAMIQVLVATAFSVLLST